MTLATRQGKKVNACKEYESYVLNLDSADAFVEFKKKGCKVVLKRIERQKISKFRLTKEKVIDEAFRNNRVGKESATIRDAEYVISKGIVVHKEFSYNPRFYQGLKNLTPYHAPLKFTVDGYKQMFMDLNLKEIDTYSVSYTGMNPQIVKQMKMKLVRRVFVAAKPRVVLNEELADLSQDLRHWKSLQKTKFGNLQFNKWKILKKVSDDDIHPLLAVRSTQSKEFNYNELSKQAGWNHIELFRLTFEPFFGAPFVIRNTRTASNLNREAQQCWTNACSSSSERKSCFCNCLKDRIVQLLPFQANIQAKCPESKPKKKAEPPQIDYFKDNYETNFQSLWQMFSVDSLWTTIFPFIHERYVGELLQRTGVNQAASGGLHDRARGCWTGCLQTVAKNFPTSSARYYYRRICYCKCLKRMVDGQGLSAFWKKNRSCEPKKQQQVAVEMESTFDNVLAYKFA